MPHNNPIELKKVKDAIAERYPMYWERKARTFQLHAVTYTWENGNFRSRKLFEAFVLTDETLNGLRDLNAELRQAGVSIDDNQLAEQIDGFYDNYKMDDGMYILRPQRMTL